MIHSSLQSVSACARYYRIGARYGYDRCARLRALCCRGGLRSLVACRLLGGGNGGLLRGLGSGGFPVAFGLLGGGESRLLAFIFSLLCGGLFRSGLLCGQSGSLLCGQ